MTEMQAHKDGTQYVTLGIDREVFAVAVDKVREILDICPVSRVPNAPPFMLGVIDVRGRPVPVIDLRLRFGLSPVEKTENTRIVVIEVEVGSQALMMGLMADRVYEVTSLDEHGISPPPDIGVRWRSDYIQGVGRRGDAFVIIVDLGRLFSTDEIAALA